MNRRTALGIAALLASAAVAYGCGSSVDAGAGGATTSASSAVVSSSSGGASSKAATSSTKAAVVASSSAGPVATVGAGGGGGGGGDLSFTPCNPVEGCGGAYDCDVGDNDDFECLGGDPSDADACGACDEMNGPYCKDGYTCLPSGGCSRYCCDDADCGAGNSCDLTLYVDLGYLDTMHGVGVCVLGSLPDGGAGGSGAGGNGGAGGGFLTGLMCVPDAPATSPSMGTCWTM